jgi:hypothetical protein
MCVPAADLSPAQDVEVDGDRVADDERSDDDVPLAQVARRRLSVCRLAHLLKSVRLSLLMCC